MHARARLSQGSTIENLPISAQTPTNSTPQHQSSTSRTATLQVRNIQVPCNANEATDARSLDAEPQKKRSSFEKLQKNKSVDIPKAKLDELLLKLLFTWEREYSDVYCVHLEAFVGALCPSYSSPSPQHLETEVLGVATEMIFKDNAKEEKTHTLWVQLLDVEEKVLMISAVIGTCQYIHIDFMVLCTVLQDDFEEFCKESCDKALNLYDTKIYSIIHNAEFQFEKLKIDDERLVFVSKSFSNLVDELEKKQKFSVDYEIKNDIDHYFEELKTLRSELGKNNSLAEGTQRVLNFLLAQPLHMNEQITNAIDEILQPLHYAAVPLNSVHRASILENSYLKSKAFRYLTNIVKELQRLSGIKHYIAGIEGFQLLFKELHQHTIEDSWRNAHCAYPDLSNVAFSLLHVPAMPKLLDETKLTILAKTDNDDLDPDSVLMLLTVQLEQL
ncbi:hypothetical protein QAD02_021616 [Eretmocerus hayati]|uniref:Uncharacterized protein n=1 Tax=Eretmocerus hayati TaxID=131215 RepID=A0ACC2PQR4_9HYME|nr:hypothetical protein QAD02_021616 [Eretmocerus hayati]